MCALPPPKSVGEQPKAGAWKPRWVCLTRDSLEVWAPAGAGGGSFDANIPTSLLDDGAAARCGSLRLELRLRLLDGCGVLAEGLQGGPPSASALQGTDWLLWSPLGTWVFRAGSESDAAAWLLHVNAVLVGQRGGMGAALPPLLLGDGDVAAVAEATAGWAALRAHGELAAIVGAVAAGATSGGARWLHLVLGCAAVRARLRRLCAKSLPEHAPLLRAWEHIRAAELLSTVCSASAGSVGGDGVKALLGLVRAALWRFFHPGAEEPVRLPPGLSSGLDAALAVIAQVARDGEEAPSVSEPPTPFAESPAPPSAPAPASPNAPVTTPRAAPTGVVGQAVRAIELALEAQWSSVGVGGGGGGDGGGGGEGGGRGGGGASGRASPSATGGGASAAAARRLAAALLPVARALERMLQVDVLQPFERVLLAGVQGWAEGRDARLHVAAAAVESSLGGASVPVPVAARSTLFSQRRLSPGGAAAQQPASLQRRGSIIGSLFGGAAAGDAPEAPKRRGSWFFRGDDQSDGVQTRRAVSAGPLPRRGSFWGGSGGEELRRGSFWGGSGVEELSRNRSGSIAIESGGGEGRGRSGSIIGRLLSGAARGRPSAAEMDAAVRSSHEAWSAAVENERSEMADDSFLLDWALPAPALPSPLFGSVNGSITALSSPPPPPPLPLPAASRSSSLPSLPSLSLPPTAIDAQRALCCAVPPSSVLCVAEPALAAVAGSTDDGGGGGSPSPSSPATAASGAPRADAPLAALLPALLADAEAWRRSWRAVVERTPPERVAAALEGVPRFEGVSAPALARALREAGLDRGEARASMGGARRGVGGWAGFSFLWGTDGAFLSGLAPLPAGKLTLRVRDAVVEAVLLTAEFSGAAGAEGGAAAAPLTASEPLAHPKLSPGAYFRVFGARRPARGAGAAEAAATAARMRSLAPWRAVTVDAMALTHTHPALLLLEGYHTGKADADVMAAAGAAAAAVNAAPQDAHAPHFGGIFACPPSLLVPGVLLPRAPAAAGSRFVLASCARLALPPPRARRRNLKGAPGSSSSGGGGGGGGAPPAAPASGPAGPSAPVTLMFSPAAPARYPVHISSRTLCWALWSPALPGGIAAAGAAGVVEGAADFPTQGTVKLNLIGEWGDLPGGQPPPVNLLVDFAAGTRALQRLLQRDTAGSGVRGRTRTQWRTVLVSIHSDGAVSVEEPAERAAAAVAGAQSAWRLLELRGAPGGEGDAGVAAYGLFHISSALDVSASRGVWAHPAAIDIALACGAAPPGVLTLLPVSVASLGGASGASAAAEALRGPPGSAPARALAPKDLLEALRKAARDACNACVSGRDKEAARLSEEAARAKAPPPKANDAFPFEFSVTCGVFIPTELTRLPRKVKVQITSSMRQPGARGLLALGAPPLPPGQCAVLAGELWKRGALSTAFKRRAVRLVYTVGGAAQEGELLWNRPATSVPPPPQRAAAPSDDTAGRRRSRSVFSLGTEIEEKLAAGPQPATPAKKAPAGAATTPANVGGGFLRFLGLGRRSAEGAAAGGGTAPPAAVATVAGVPSAPLTLLAALAPATPTANPAALAAATLPPTSPERPPQVQQLLSPPGAAVTPWSPYGEPQAPPLPVAAEAVPPALLLSDALRLPASLRRVIESRHGPAAAEGWEGSGSRTPAKAKAKAAGAAGAASAVKAAAGGGGGGGGGSSGAAAAAGGRVPLFTLRAAALSDTIPAAGALAPAELRLEYLKGTTVRGAISLWSGALGAPNLLALQLTAVGSGGGEALAAPSAAAATPTPSRFLRWGSTSLSAAPASVAPQAFSWQLLTPDRAWQFGCADASTAAAWLCVLATCGPTRDAVLARCLPPIAAAGGEGDLKMQAAAAQPFVGGLPEALHAITYESPGDGAQLFQGAAEGVPEWDGK
jgi:hypothetical protein